MIFAELEIGARFQIVDLRTARTTFQVAMLRTRAAKWTDVPSYPRWTLDYNCVRVEPGGDLWDRIWCNSDYTVELLEEKDRGSAYLPAYRFEAPVR